eukprot:CAMPEP_0115242044 /NCGR_PEP_ID=MMETSP0270-20121206/38743_1 /TAXON_ID=71861 /ORGANISM="Scrippsiella trochoidea, Strain CCMP3099" /LENGTH=62 /DNA_ID=CAMNT_0002657085 /DNA_START=132 /DNA_END=320 /DNA_ORIENTATION=+
MQWLGSREAVGAPCFLGSSSTSAQTEVAHSKLAQRLYDSIFRIATVGSQKGFGNKLFLACSG